MKRLLAMMAALLLLPGLAGAEKLVVSEPVHLIGYLPLYVAIHEGYFADEGLDVSVVQATGGAHITAVVSGDAFAVMGGVDSTYLGSRDNPDPIVSIVGCVNRANVYLFAVKGTAPASGSDEDLADFLRGKVIVAGRYGGSPNLLIRSMLNRIGLDAENDVTRIENADESTVTAMLRHGQGDIGNGGEPQISEGITQDIWEEPFVKFPDLGDYAYSVLSVRKSTIEQQPELCQRFVRAVLRGLQAVHNDHELAARVLAEEFPTLTEAGRAAALDRAWEDNLWSTDGYVTEAAVANTMHVLMSSGVHEGEWDYNALVDMQFVDALAAEAAAQTAAAED